MFLGPSWPVHLLHRPADKPYLLEAATHLYWPCLNSLPIYSVPTIILQFGTYTIEILVIFQSKLLGWEAKLLRTTNITIFQDEKFPGLQTINIHFHTLLLIFIIHASRTNKTFIHFYTFPSFLQTSIFKNALFIYIFSFLKMEICRNEGKV